MTVKIRRIRTATSAEWDQNWKECDFATYFHSREWYEIWHVYKGDAYRPEPRLITFTDGKSAVIPLACVLEKANGLIKNYMSSPEGTYGGWVSKDPLAVEHEFLLADYMLKQCGNLYWRVNPFDEHISKFIKIKQDQDTHIIELSGGFEGIQKDFSRGNTRSIKKAVDFGLTTHLSTDPADWEVFFEIYQDAVKRWGNNASSQYSWELFKEFQRRDSKDIKLWFAEDKGKKVSGAIAFYAKKHVVGWCGTTLSDYLKLSPFTLLVTEIIKKASEENFKWFDFNPSGKHAGVESWKDKFGAKTLHCPIVLASAKSTLLYQRLFNLLSIDRHINARTNRHENDRLNKIKQAQ